jgi:hypothetical protein
MSDRSNIKEGLGRNVREAKRELYKPSRTSLRVDAFIVSANPNRNGCCLAYPRLGEYCGVGTEIVVSQTCSACGATRCDSVKQTGPAEKVIIARLPICYNMFTPIQPHATDTTRASSEPRGPHPIVKMERDLRRLYSLESDPHTTRFAIDGCAFPPEAGVRVRRRSGGMMVHFPTWSIKEWKEMWTTIWNDRKLRLLPARSPNCGLRLSLHTFEPSTLRPLFLS